MDDPARDGEWRASAEALAAELREVIAAFNTNGPPAAALAEALELARSLRARLDGSPRPRWYQSDDVKRPAYADMSPVRGRLNPVAPPLRIEVLERDPARLRVEGRARLSLAYEAPPRGAHGGWVAALFDDLLSSVQGLSPVPGYTRSLEVRFRAVTPAGARVAPGGLARKRKRPGTADQGRVLRGRKNSPPKPKRSSSRRPSARSVRSSNPTREENPSPAGRTGGFDWANADGRCSARRGFRGFRREGERRWESS